jgi:hypothetical protein
MSLASTGRCPEATDARTATLTLLASRARGATICPSEVARRIAKDAGRTDWRAEMAGVHAAIDTLVADGVVRLSWKGSETSVRAGPYRIGRGSLDE